MSVDHMSEDKMCDVKLSVGQMSEYKKYVDEVSLVVIFMKCLPTKSFWTRYL